MRLRIFHETRYDYRPAVDDGQHVACLKPRDLAHQTLLSYRLRIVPEPVVLLDALDRFGNTRHQFSLRGAHDSLLVQSESLVQTWAAPPLRERATLAWERVRDRTCDLGHGGEWLEFAHASPRIEPGPAFADFARPSFTPGRPIAEAAWDLMQRIHRHMRYESRSTEVDTPALDALRQAKGVCQDFAHILVACCRSLGVPARYVSGYLLTQPPPGQPRLVGSDASHAWAAVYCPLQSEAGGFWLDLDPTNDRSPGEDYVTVAVGRDFQDVSPLAGLIRGGDDHVLSVAVTVLPEERSTQDTDALA